LGVLVLAPTPVIPPLAPPGVILGGGRLLAIRKVLAPLLKRSLAGAWILVFIPATRELSADMMREAQAVAEKLGVTFRVPLEKRIEGAAKVGKHKTSTLQDVEAGRPVEVDALIGSVIELGELTGTPTPATRAVYALLKLLVKTMHDEGARVVMQRV